MTPLYRSRGRPGHQAVCRGPPVCLHLPRWYYLVDTVDGYSRFWPKARYTLVHWSLNLAMEADTVAVTVQEALERLPGRRPSEPKVVHDHGSQFIGAEWRRFVEAAGVTDIPTRVAHPQSNGIAEHLL